MSGILAAIDSIAKEMFGKQQKLIDEESGEPITAEDLCFLYRRLYLVCWWRLLNEL